MNNEYDIRAVFEEMELELIRSMRRNLSRHQKWESKEGINWTMWQSEQLKTLERFKKENKDIFTKKFTNVNNEIARLLEDTYKTSGFKQEREILEKLSKGEIFTDSVGEGLEGSFFNINEKKMHALINAVNNDMDKAERAMLRMANDQYRKIIYKSQVMANSGAFTLKQSIDKASRDFLKRGFNCIQYKDGRRVNIASYAEMAIRTANKRAMLTSEAEARDAYGIHTVRVSKYSQCSETCLPWQGKVYVDDVWGKGTKEEADELHLPLLSIAVDRGLFHPNCRHRVTTYFYDLKEEQGKLEDDGIEITHEEQEHRKNQLRIQQQERLETGSLDPKNIAEAKHRREEKIELPSKKYNDDVSFVCKIEGVEEIEKEYGKLKNYDVVLTDERRQHILERRGQKDFEIIMKNLKRTIKDYDEIFDDSNKDKKGICYVKKIDEDKYCTIHISLSLKNEDYANSQITGIIRNQKKYEKLKNKRKLVAKKVK